MGAIWEAVLFDLDGTLLDIDMDRFLPEYIGGMAEALASHTDPEQFPLWVQAATGAVLLDTEPGRTNEQVFWEAFAGQSGLEPAAVAPAIDKYYAEKFPALAPLGRPMEGARRAVEAARANARRVILATNPLFPAAATYERLRWAGFAPEEMDFITTYENSSSCKPRAEYYEEILERFGITSPGRVLMIGNDRVLDLAAAAAGLKTFHFVNPDTADGASAAGPAGQAERLWLEAAGIDQSQYMYEPDFRGRLDEAAAVISGRKTRPDI